MKSSTCARAYRTTTLGGGGASSEDFQAYLLRCCPSFPTVEGQVIPAEHLGQMDDDVVPGPIHMLHDVCLLVDMVWYDVPECF